MRRDKSHLENLKQAQKVFYVGWMENNNKKHLSTSPTHKIPLYNYF